MPPIDPDNEQFVIYVRSKRGIKAWYPLNVVTGGSAANTLVKGLDSSISKEMKQKSLAKHRKPSTRIWMPLKGRAIDADAEASEGNRIRFRRVGQGEPAIDVLPSTDKVWLIRARRSARTRG